VTRADDRVVLIAIGPGDEHVVIVSPAYGRDVMITTTTITEYNSLFSTVQPLITVVYKM